MAWQDETIPMLRALIGDFNVPHEYSDNRLEQLLTVAAHYTLTDMSFGSTYTISVSDTSISPDPTVANDTSFLNFMVLKAACIIDKGSMRLAAAVEGIEARMGASYLRVASRMYGYGVLIDKGYCGAYEAAKLQYSFGDTGFCRGILSPFTNANFNPNDYGPNNKIDNRHLKYGV